MHHLYIPVRKRERPHRKFLFTMVTILKVFLINHGLPDLKFRFAKASIAGINEYYILHICSYIILYIENGGVAFLQVILFDLRRCGIARHTENRSWKFQV